MVYDLYRGSVAIDERNLKFETGNSITLRNVEISLSFKFRVSSFMQNINLISNPVQ